MNLVKSWLQRVLGTSQCAKTSQRILLTRTNISLLISAWSKSPTWKTKNNSISWVTARVVLGHDSISTIILFWLGPIHKKNKPRGAHRKSIICIHLLQIPFVFLSVYIVVAPANLYRALPILHHNHVLFRDCFSGVVFVAHLEPIAIARQDKEHIYINLI